MTAHWFVMSRGQLVTHDYVWYGFDKQDPEHAQDVLDRGYAGRKCRALVNTERTGLMLYDDQRGNLVLLVTGLIPKGDPADFQRRPIRATVLGVAGLEDEAGCRGLVAVAVAALLDNLGANIPIGYGGTGGAGFEVADGRWTSYVTDTASRLERDGTAEAETARVDPDTPQNRLEVAQETATLFLRDGLRSLANRMIVLRTNRLDVEDLREIYPWRTLTDAVDKTEPLPPPRQPGPGGIVEVLGVVVDAVKNHPLRGVLGGSGLAAVVAVLVVLFSSATGKPMLPPAHTHSPSPPVVGPGALAWGNSRNGDLGAAGTTIFTAADGGYSGTPEAAAGADFSLVLLSGRKVFAWGSNADGQLGGGPGPGGAKPVLVDLPSRISVKSISAGCEHSLALTTGGAVLAWGDNADGQLGVPSKKVPDSARPITVKLPGKVKAISAGCNDSLALMTSGAVYAWGALAKGELGARPASAGTEPHRVNLTAKVTAVSAGCSFSLALASNGTVYAWGTNSDGQLGDPSAGAISKVPVIVTGTGPGHDVVKQIAAGCYHSLALTGDGAVLGWGSDKDGQLGDGVMTKYPVHKPKAALLSNAGLLAPGAKVITIYAGNDYSLALTSTGQVLAWGADDKNQLGGAKTDKKGSPYPVLVALDAGDLKAVALGAGPGASHSLAIGQLTH